MAIVKTYMEPGGVVNICDDCFAGKSVEELRAVQAEFERVGQRIARNYARRCAAEAAKAAGE